MSSDFRIYSGKELLNSDHVSIPPVIESLLYERKNILCIADVKSGKSVFTLQMAYSLTSGDDFLDKFKIPVPVNVLYVQTEGSKEETIERMKRMAKAIPIDPERFRLYYHWGLGLNIEKEFLDFIQLVEKDGFKPKVVIFDPLYTSIRGSLSDPEVVSGVVRNFRRLNEMWECSTFTNHHIRKLSFNSEGEAIEAGSQASFGSQFWRAFVDAIFIVKMDKKEKKILFECTEQRSGELVESIPLFLHQPDPLWLELVQGSGHRTIGTNACTLLSIIESKGSEGVSLRTLIDQSGFSERSIYYALRDLFSNNKIGKGHLDGSKQVLYFQKETNS